MDYTPAKVRNASVDFSNMLCIPHILQSIRKHDFCSILHLHSKISSMADILIIIKKHKIFKLILNFN